MATLNQLTEELRIASEKLEQMQSDNAGYDKTTISGIEHYIRDVNAQLDAIERIQTRMIQEIKKVNKILGE